MRGKSSLFTLAAPTPFHFICSDLMQFTFDVGDEADVIGDEAVD